MKVSLDLSCTHITYWIQYNSLLHAVLHVAYAQQRSSKIQESVSLCVLVCVCACWEGLKGGIQYNIILYTGIYPHQYLEIV